MSEASSPKGRQFQSSLRNPPASTATSGLGDWIRFAPPASYLKQQNNTENVWSNSFQDGRCQAMKDSNSWETEGKMRWALWLAQLAGPENISRTRSRKAEPRWNPVDSQSWGNSQASRKNKMARDGRREPQSGHPQKVPLLHAAGRSTHAREERTRGGKRNRSNCPTPTGGSEGCSKGRKTVITPARVPCAQKVM